MSVFRRSLGGGIRWRRVRTADGGFLVFLEVVVHETEYEGRLKVSAGQCQLFQAA